MKEEEDRMEEDNRKRKSDNDEVEEGGKRAKEGSKGGEKREIDEKQEESPVKKIREEGNEMEIDEIDNEKLRIIESGKFDLSNEKIRQEIKEMIKSKKVDLFMSNEAINYVRILESCSRDVGKEDFKRTLKLVRDFVEEICKIQDKNCLYYIKEERDRGEMRLAGRNVVIRKGSNVVVKNYAVDDNLGKSKSVNDKPPGEIEIISKNEGCKVRETRYSKWMHWVIDRMRDKMQTQNRIDYVGIGCSFASEINEIERRKEYWDDMSGKKLKEDKVKQAREEEMAEVRKHKVYVKVPISQCIKDTGKGPIGTRWVDINKGDEVNEEYRSRLVAQELKSKSIMEDMFAATPPLEVKKMLFSMAVTEGIGYYGKNKKGGMKIEFIDIRRAYFHSPARRKVYVKLPEEDYEEGMCGMLLKSMYGTRDAAQNWEWSYVKAMTDLGFDRGVAIPCLFYHKERNVRVAVHGDDFTILGNSEGLDWFKKEIIKLFEVKVRGRIGPGDKDEKSIRLLNRVFEWTEEGIYVEADQRHAELIVRDMNFKDNTKSVVTPGERLKEINEEPLDSRRATMYRACVARGNYLTQDRSDVQYAVKELCRSMSDPREEDWDKLKRLGRYLSDKLRVRMIYEYQGRIDKIEVYTDTDYAGCLKTRKSTSGGVVTFGKHVLKTWSLTQGVVSLSSGEAEYYGLVKGASQGLGFKSMYREAGIEIGVVVKTDASAAKAIATRRGMGKVRQIEVSQLWVQEKVAVGDIKIVKIPTEDNFADHLTKYQDRTGIGKYMCFTNQKIVEGRHKLMPDISD